MKRIILLLIIVLLMPLVYAHTTCPLEANMEITTENNIGDVYPCETNDPVGETPCYCYDTSSDYFQSYLLFNISECESDLDVSEIITSTLKFTFEEGAYDEDVFLYIVEEDAYIIDYVNNKGTLSIHDSLTKYSLYGDELYDACGGGYYGWYYCNLDITSEVLGNISNDNAQDINKSITFKLQGKNNVNMDSFYVDDFTHTDGESAYLELYYNLIPELTQIPDQYASENGDASNINVDLWNYYTDDDDDTESTFYIAAESNAYLIDCNITSNRYFRCLPPTENRTGFSNVFVRAVDDGSIEVNQTIKVYVNGTAEITLDINGSEAWVGYHGEPHLVDIRPEVEEYMEGCDPDDEGNCQVPINFTSNASASELKINWLSVSYYVPYFEFTGAVDDYVNSNCADSSCLVPLTFGTSTQGELNLTNLQFFHMNLTVEEESIDTIFTLKDSSSNTRLYVNDTGDMWILGVLDENTAHSISGNDEFIVNYNSDDVFILDYTNGNLYIDENIYENQTSLTPTADSFIIKDGATIVAYINKTGSMFLTGTLTQGGA